MDITTIQPIILNKLKEWIQDRINSAASQNEAAKQLDISPAQLINFRKGVWESISSRMFNKILAKSGISTWGTYRTRNLAIASSIASAAQRTSKMIGLTGYTGAGKTETLKLYASKTKGAYYVLIDNAMSRSQFFNDICQALGIENEKSGLYPSTMLPAICDKLNQLNKPLLILDDCGKAKVDILRMIQIIYDRTEHHAGILLSGTEKFKKIIDRGAARDATGFRELTRRIAWWQEMENMSKDDLKNVCHGNGISNQSAIDYLHKNVGDFGTLRNMIENALLFTKGVGTAVNRELLVEMNANKIWYKR